MYISIDILDIHFDTFCLLHIFHIFPIRWFVVRLTVLIRTRILHWYHLIRSKLRYQQLESHSDPRTFSGVAEKKPHAACNTCKVSPWESFSWVKHSAKNIFNDSNRYYSIYRAMKKPISFCFSRDSGGMHFHVDDPKQNLRFLPLAFEEESPWRYKHCLRMGQPPGQNKWDIQVGKFRAIGIPHLPIRFPRRFFWVEDHNPCKPR